MIRNKQIFNRNLWTKPSHHGDVSVMIRQISNFFICTCQNYVVFVTTGFLFLLVLGIGYVILLWLSLGFQYNYFHSPRNHSILDIHVNVMLNW